MIESKIATWQQINGFLELEGVSDDSLATLWGNLDVENVSLADVILKIEGPNYDSTIRSDFAEAISIYQTIFNRQILFILGDRNPYRQLSKIEKENFLFYISVNKGCTKLILKLSKPIVAAVAKRIEKMKPSHLCLTLIFIAAIIQIPKLYDTWAERDVKLKEIENKSAETIARDNVLQKISTNDETKAILASPEFVKLKEEIFKEIKEQQIRASHVLIRNTGEVEKITLNDYVYSIPEIQEIKDTQDEEFIPSDSKIVKGLFLITSIDRLRYPILKLHLKSFDKNNATVDATVNSDTEDESLKVKIKLIWEFCEKGLPLEFILNETVLKDGKIKNAYIEGIEIPKVNNNP